MIWPWQEQSTDGVDILTKKKLFDQLMLASRLTEEKQILVKEMMQHCQYLKDSVAKVQSLMATVSVSTQTGNESLQSCVKIKVTSYSPDIEKICSDVQKQRLY